MNNPDPDIDNQFDEPDPDTDADESQSKELNERYSKDVVTGNQGSE